MSDNLRFSMLEQFRRQNHGDKRLRFLRLNPDNGDELFTIKTVDAGFYLNFPRDFASGQRRANLTVDIETAEMTEAQLLSATVVDLIDPADSSFKRYIIDTNAPPVFNFKRYSVGLDAAFNDARIVQQQTFEFEQPGASTVWSIVHNFGANPVATEVYTFGGMPTFPSTEEPIDENTYQMTFVAPFAGRAILYFE